MAGRKATPINVHKLKGTYRKSRHEAASRVETDFGIPTCPEWLSDRAKAAWAHFAPLLNERQILTIADGSALTVLAETFAEWSQLSEDLRTEGLTYECKTSSGAIMRRPNPKVTMRSDAARRLSGCFAEFGLSPAYRPKVAGAVSGKPKENKFARLGV